MEESVTYKDIPDWPGYRVGDDGSVWSCIIRGGTAATKGSIGTRWKKLTPSRHKDGYPQIKLRGRWHLVHSLVLAAFVGPRPDEYEACHNNGMRSDNRLKNLRWDTVSGNQKDRVVHGTSNRGEGSGNTTLKEEDVRAIRARREAGERVRAIAEDYGVCTVAITKICNRQRWAHVA